MRRNMKAGVYELNDGSYLGIDLLEILSFPSGALFSSGEKECYNEIYQRFVSLISGYHSLAGNGACAELLWITDQMKNQSVKSRIRMFLVLRQIGK